jgi:hypothetical protein
VAHSVVAFGGPDLKFGLDRGFVKAKTVVAIAADQARRGSTDDVVARLAATSKDDLEHVTDAFSYLGGPDRVHDPRDSSRKWLYLQLKAAFVSPKRCRTR